jgi:hypothetical protein
VTVVGDPSFEELGRLLPDTALVLRNVTISRLATGALPFLSPADTVALHSIVIAVNTHFSFPAEICL